MCQLSEMHRHHRSLRLRMDTRSSRTRMHRTLFCARARGSACVRAYRYIVTYAHQDPLCFAHGDRAVLLDDFIDPAHPALLLDRKHCAALLRALSALLLPSRAETIHAQHAGCIMRHAACSSPLWSRAEPSASTWVDAHARAMHGPRPCANGPSPNGRDIIQQRNTANTQQSGNRRVQQRQRGAHALAQASRPAHL